MVVEEGEVQKDPFLRKKCWDLGMCHKQTKREEDVKDGSVEKRHKSEGLKGWLTV